MSYILTLIAAPGNAAPLDHMSRELAARFNTEPHWLSEGAACDLAINAPDHAAGDTVPGYAAALQAARALIGDAPIDAVIQPAANRRKRLLLADMDSTIIEQECLDEVADAAGIGPQIAAITERAMRGDLIFEAALKERIALLDGFPAARLQQVLDERVTLMRGARTLTATMTAHGARCVLVSGGFRFFTRAVAEMAGFHAEYGNDFIIDNGAIRGVREPILGREAKLETLRGEAETHGIAMAQTLGVGDGANDLAMLQAAGLGVAFRAKPVVAAAASAQINHGDLTSLLYIQGYRDSEFIRG